LFVDRDGGEWTPMGGGAYEEMRGPYQPLAKLHSSGALSVDSLLARAEGGEYIVYFGRLVALLHSVYEYVARLYAHTGRLHGDLHVRVWLERIEMCRRLVVSRPDREYPVKGLDEGDAILLDEVVDVVEVVRDGVGSMKPMLDQLWRAFGMAWEVPEPVVRELLRGRGG
jgi:hypothetical protein